MEEIITGKAYVVGDNIDTDQIIPAQYLNLVPTIKEEYLKLGSFALSGLPDSYKQRFVLENQPVAPYSVIIAGRNFGCGSSREHAPISLGAAGAKAVVAESFARIFFRNCISTGELYPIESKDRLCKSIKTGDTVTLDLRANTLKTSNTAWELLDPGDVKEVINHGGLFNYARHTGMIENPSAKS